MTYNIEQRLEKKKTVLPKGAHKLPHLLAHLSVIVCFFFLFFLLLFLFVLCTAKCVMKLLLLLVGGVCADVHVVMATFVVGNAHRIGWGKTSMLKSGSLPFMFGWCSV